MVNLFKNQKEIQVYAPVNGKICDISKVKDPMFAEKMLGDGCAILAEDGLIGSPCDGVVTMIANTSHAFGITTKQGIELLVHVGLDTVNLQGKGFQCLAKVKQKVKANDPILKVDMSYMKEQGMDMTIPIIVINPNGYQLEKKFQQGKVGASTKIMTLIKK